MTYDVKNAILWHPYWGPAKKVMPINAGSHNLNHHIHDLMQKESRPAVSLTPGNMQSRHVPVSVGIYLYHCIVEKHLRHMQLPCLTQSSVHNRIIKRYIMYRCSY